MINQRIEINNGYLGLINSIVTAFNIPCSNFNHKSRQILTVMDLNENDWEKRKLQLNKYIIQIFEDEEFGKQELMQRNFQEYGGYSKNVLGG